MADTGNDRLRVVNIHTGMVETVSGTGRQTPSVDGNSGSDSNINTPMMLAAASNGGIIFTEATRIRPSHPSCFFVFRRIFPPRNPDLDPACRRVYPPWVDARAKEAYRQRERKDARPDPKLNPN